MFHCRSLSALAFCLALSGPFALASTEDPCAAGFAPEFVVGGSNTQEAIANIQGFNGKTLAQIEAQMRPGARGTQGSIGGFLGEHESLVDVLSRDNTLVRDQFHLTHQKLAEPLLKILKRYDAGKLSNGDTFEYKGTRYRFDVLQSHGVQFSPFFDQTGGSCIVTVTRLQDGRSIKFADLVPTMIQRYGFYEGPESPFRVAPESIAEVFGLRTKRP